METGWGRSFEPCYPAAVPRSKLSDVDPWEVIGLIAEGESDRGAILAAGEFLSLALAELVAARVVDEPFAAGPNLPSGSKKFLQRNQDFTLRIQAAWALGLLRPAEYRNLCRVVAMRNEVAHVPMHVDFRTQKIADHCAGLEWPPGDRSPESQGRMRFFEIVKYTFATLVERTPGVRRATPWRAPEFPDIPPPPPLDLPPGMVAGAPLIDVVFESDESKRED